MAEMQKNKSGGVKHWLAQRITAIMLMPLIIYGVSGFILNTGADYYAARAWLTQPVNAIAMLLLFGVGLLHAVLGLEVIIDDYVAEGRRGLLHMLTKSIAMLLAATAAVAVISVFMG